MNRRTVVPSIPDPTPDGLVELARSVKNLLDVREGRTGDKQDRFVSFRDLEDLKLITDANASANNPGGGTGTGGGGGYDPTTDFTTPPAPTGFRVNGGYGVIMLDWDTPQAQYKNHAYTEIWRNTVDVLGNAVLIGTTIASVYTDPVPASRTYYYWIRFVSQANVTGPYNSTSGTSGTSSIDVVGVLDALSREITGSQLYNDLGTRIVDLEAQRAEADALLRQFNADLLDARTALSDAIASSGSAIITAQTINATQAKKITSLGTRLGNAESSILNLQTTTANQATSLTSLTTRVGDAESNITSLLTTTANQATSLTSLTTRVGTAESNITNLQTTTATQASSLSSLTTRVGTAESNITTLQTTTANQATSISQLSSTVNGNTTSIQTLQTTTNGLSAQYSVKIDNNGHVSGFGLSSTVVNGTPTSAFIVRADKFAIAGPNDTTNGLGTTDPSSTTIPFIVVPAGGTTQDGVTYPAGTYIRAAYIADATITAAKIANATITSAQIASGTITTANIANATITMANIADTIQSSNWNAVSNLGWQINKTGAATFNQVTVRGTVYATAGSFTGSITAASGTIGGCNIGSDYIRSTNWNGSNAGWNITSGGAATFYNVAAQGGTIGSCVIGSSYIQSTNYSANTSGWRIESGGNAYFNGLVTSAQIRSGSQLIDAVSGYEIKSIASSAWNATNLNGSSVQTDSSMMFYGPYVHGSSTVYKRIKNGAVLVQVIASAVLDHYFTLWYRYNGGTWYPLASTVEPQSGYGTATVVYSGEFGIGPSDTVQFGASATDIYGNAYNGGQTTLAIVSIVANLSNI